jgi:sterol regulatory element-binding transcription factor 1
VSTIDGISGVMWQLFRQFLHRLYLGRWLAARAGGLRSSSVTSAEVKESARDAAFVYHLLNQLHLTGMCVCVCVSVCSMEKKCK